jgi:hypothetical protein
LIPFTASLGIDVGITSERVFGPAGEIATGAAVGADLGQEAFKSYQDFAAKVTPVK